MRAERHRRLAPAACPEPRAAPRVAHVLPALDRRAVAVQRGEGVLLGAHLLERVARFGGDARPDGDRVAQHDVVRVFAKERQHAGPGATVAARRLPGDVRR